MSKKAETIKPLMEQLAEHFEGVYVVDDFTKPKAKELLSAFGITSLVNLEDIWLFSDSTSERRESDFPFDYTCISDSRFVITENYSFFPDWAGEAWRYSMNPFKGAAIRNRIEQQFNKEKQRVASSLIRFSFYDYGGHRRLKIHTNQGKICAMGHPMIGSFQRAIDDIETELNYHFLQLGQP